MATGVVSQLYPNAALITDAVSSAVDSLVTLDTNVVVNANGTTYYYAAFGHAVGLFKTGAYVGAGSTQIVTGLGFSPDMVWVIPSNASLQRWHGPASAGDRGQTFEANEVTGIFTSMDADGFTVTSALATNGVTYYWAAWAEAGDFFEGISYAGNSTDNRTLTGAGFEPDLAMVQTKTVLGVEMALRFAANVGDSSTQITASGFVANKIQAFTADGIEVGTNASVNSSVGGATYHGIFFKSLAGVLVQGTYVGTGAAQDIDVSVNPALVIFKGGSNRAVVWITDLPDSAGGGSYAFIA